MKQLLTLGLSLLWNPHQSWIELRLARFQSRDLLGYILLMSFFAALLRMGGYLSLDWSPLKAITGALFYVLFLIGTASASGIVITSLTRRWKIPFPEALAQRIVLISTTPALLLCALYPMRQEAWIHTVIFLGSLAWGGFLIFRGLWAMVAARNREILVLSLATCATWILSATVLIQVGHLILSS